METILDEHGEFYGLVSGPDASSVTLPADWPSFVCLIWDSAGTYSAHARLTLSRKLIAAGCRYAVCGGLECEAWHDSVDGAYAELGRDFEETDNRFVMTTWHRDEWPNAVAFFFVNCTDYEDNRFSDHLLLHLGSNAGLESELKRSVIRHALSRESS